MGIFKTITKKLLMCSAKQLGIAAVASLSVMTASFSAIAYNGYRESLKQMDAKKEGSVSGESRFQQVFYNHTADQSDSEKNNGATLKEAVSIDSNISGASENTASEAPKKNSSSETSENETIQQDIARSASDTRYESEEDTNSAKGAEETPETSSAESTSEAATEPSTATTKPGASATKPDTATPEATLAPEKTESAPLPQEDLNNPTTITDTAEDAQEPPVIPVKTDPFENYYGTSTFNDYNVYLDTAMGPMSYYNQHDSHWGSYLYGGQDTISKYGCGPTTAAMIVSSFGNVNGSITPKEMANWSASYGYFAPKSGSYHDYIPAVLSAFDLIVDSVKDGERTPEHIADLLNSGHILVALMGKGALTNGGHFIIITKQNPNGTVSIADPNSYDNTKKDWNPAQLMRELKKNYDAGGPLWSVRAPKA